MKLYENKALIENGHTVSDSDEPLSLRGALKMIPAAPRKPPTTTQPEAKVTKPKPATKTKYAPPEPHGWQQLAKTVFIEDRLRDSKWFTKNVRQLILPNYPKIPNIIKIADQPAFLAAVEIAYGIWCAKKGIAAKDVPEPDLPATAKDKYDAAVKAITRKLNIENEALVRTRVQDELRALLPKYQTQIDDAKAITEAFKGVFTEKEYRSLESCLHSDRLINVDEATIAKFNTAFNLLRSKKDVLCKAKRASRGTDMPSLEEMLKRRKS